MIEKLKNINGFESFSDAKIKEVIKMDFWHLVDLRNRLKDGTDDDTQIFEEDPIVIDHILDYLEIFIKEI